jgi:hypothetical protein
MSEPWLLCVVAREPLGSNSIKTCDITPLIKSLHNRPILKDAAQCELEGPLITGPITSLKMLGKDAIIIFLV